MHAAGAVLISVTPVHQKYGLDCEAASLRMALAAIGITVSQDWIINRIGADLRSPVMSGGNPVRWGDPYQTFVGHVDGDWLRTGYGVYYPPIIAAAQAAGATSFGGEGWSPSQLYIEVAEGHPVVVRVPHLMEAETVRHWTAWDGRSIHYSPQDHAQTLIGYDYGARTVTLADPLDGKIHTLAMSLSRAALPPTPSNGPYWRALTSRGRRLRRLPPVRLGAGGVDAELRSRWGTGARRGGRLTRDSPKFAAPARIGRSALMRRPACVLAGWDIDSSRLMAVAARSHAFA